MRSENQICRMFVLVIGSLLLMTASMQLHAQDSTQVLQKKQLSKLNPSNWLQQTENAILLFEGKMLTGFDTSFMNDQYPRLLKDIELTLNDFETNGHVMRIRTLDDVKAKLIQQKQALDKWRNTIRKQNDVVTTGYIEIENMMNDSLRYTVNADSALWKIYTPEFNTMDTNLVRVETMYQQLLGKTVDIENNLNTTNFRLSRSIMAVENELHQRNEAIFKRTHPAFWQLTSNSYSTNIGQVFMATLRQNLDALKFYAKNAYIRVILFRILLLLITLLPIWYFKKNKKNLEAPDKNESYKFVHKYTGAATSSFVLVMAPFIFVNSPHIFTEVILVTLAFTTSIILIKEQPAINKKYMYAMLALYVILKAMNLMVSVTLFGRIVWALSLVGLIPLFGLYRNISKTSLTSKWLFKLIFGLTALMYIAGWILNFTGHYPLGRILLLAGLDQFFLAIVLYVAIYSLIDFIAILANEYNTTNKLTKIRVDLIYHKLLNLVKFLAVVFWFSNFLININATQFLRQNVYGLTSQQISIGGYNFAPGSFLIFFLALYLAFYISGLLDGLFIDEKRSLESDSKTSLGSIVLLMRMFIISVGFIVGMIIAGIPLNNLTLFVSALGVGIGFGLQSLISNLISGLIIAFEKPVYVGDYIEIEGMRGRVTDIGMRATTVDTADGAEYVIPNGDLVSKVLKNWTLSSKNYKIDTSFMVDHLNDPEMITELVKEVMQENPIVLPYPRPKVHLQEILPNAMKFSVSCWISNIVEAGNTKSELLKKLHQRLEAAGVKYPKQNKMDD